MKIGLISPKGSFISNNPEFKSFWGDSKLTSTYRQNWSGLSTALPIIAALTPTSFEVEIIDENVDQIDFTNKYDLVGITAMTQQALRAYQIADEFRKNGITTVIGGIHATLLPDEAKGHADSVVVGEAEYIWSSVIEDFIQKKMEPLYTSTIEVNLSDSPLPRYDLIKSKKYNVFWVQATRGCPHDCEFCVASKIYGPRYRCKTADQVIDEIKFIKNNLGNVRIGFADDNLFVNKNFAEELLKKIAPLQIRWAGQSDIAIAENPMMLDLIRKSGCTFLFVGFESLSRANLSEINRSGWKLKRLTQYSEYIKEIQSHGIGVMGAFIYGFDEDTPAVFEKTIQFVIDNYLYDAQFGILTPFPGTQIRKKLLEEKRVLSTGWDNYSVFDVNFIPKKMSMEQLQKGLLDSYQKVNTSELYEKKIMHFKNIYKKIKA